MLLHALDDDQLLNAYRWIPPGDAVLDAIHKEILHRGEGVWCRVENLFFGDDGDVARGPAICKRRAA